MPCYDVATADSALEDAQNQHHASIDIEVIMDEQPKSKIWTRKAKQLNRKSESTYNYHHHNIIRARNVDTQRIVHAISIHTKHGERLDTRCHDDIVALGKRQ